MESNNTNVVEQALRSIEIGIPIYHAGLTVFPLFFIQTKRLNHLILEEALESNLAEITETSESGNVPELLFWNKSDTSVFLMDGEELIGAKQNRIINISILVAAKTKVKIPVSCVEAGRWSYRSRNFSAGDYAPASMRSRTKSETMHNARHYKNHTSDQGRVWADVDNLMADFEVHSDSSAMRDSYEFLAERMNESEQHLQLPESANGYIACLGDRVIGGDIFSRSDILHKKWKRLSRSFIIEGLRLKTQPEQSDAAIARNFLDTAATSVAEPYKTPGIGSGVHIDDKSVVGNALLDVDNTVVHMSMFACV